MSLRVFIDSHHEPIIREFAAFAKTLMPPGADMTEAQLRDHAAEILHESASWRGLKARKIDDRLYSRKIACAGQRSMSNWKRWRRTGFAANTRFAVVGAALVANLIACQARPRPWREEMLAVSGGEIRFTFEGTPAEPRASKEGEVNLKSLTGFRVLYTVTNQTGRDIKFAPTALIKTRRASDGALGDLPVPIVLATPLLPAGHTTQLYLQIRYAMVLENPDRVLNRLGLLKEADGGFVILDDVGRFQVHLPSPHWANGGILENPF